MPTLPPIGMPLHNRTPASVLAVALLTLSFDAASIGIGSLDVKSRLGEPLRASIGVTLREGESISPLCVRFVSPASLNDSLPTLINPRFSMERSDDGARVNLTTTRPIDDPAMRVVVEIGCVVAVTREFVLLLDPPAASGPREGLSIPRTAAQPPDVDPFSWQGAIDQTISPPAAGTPAVGPASERASGRSATARSGKDVGRTRSPGAMPKDGSLRVDDRASAAGKRSARRLEDEPPTAKRKRAAAKLTVDRLHLADAEGFVPSVSLATGLRLADGLQVEGSGGAAPLTEDQKRVLTLGQARMAAVLRGEDPEAAALLKEQEMQKRVVEIGREMQDLRRQMTLASEYAERTRAESVAPWKWYAALAFALLALLAAGWLALNLRRARREVAAGQWWDEQSAASLPAASPPSVADKAAQDVSDDESLFEEEKTQVSPVQPAPVRPPPAAPRPAPPRQQPLSDKELKTRLTASGAMGSLNTPASNTMMSIEESSLKDQNQIEVEELSATTNIMNQMMRSRGAVDIPLDFGGDGAATAPVASAPAAAVPPASSSVSSGAVQTAKPATAPGSGPTKPAPSPQSSRPVSDAMRAALGYKSEKLDTTAPAKMNLVNVPGSKAAPVDAEEDMTGSQMFRRAAGDEEAIPKPRPAPGVAPAPQVESESPGVTMPEVDFQIGHVEAPEGLPAAQPQGEPRRRAIEFSLDLPKAASERTATAAPSPHAAEPAAGAARPSAPIEVEENEDFAISRLLPDDVSLETALECQQSLRLVFKVVQEADTLIANGQLDTAVVLLRKFVHDSTDIPVTPWLLLFNLYKATDKRPIYEALSMRFGRRFGRSMPGWDNAPVGEEGRALIALPDIERAVMANWGEPDSMAAMYNVLMDYQSPDSVFFNLPLQRELLNLANTCPLRRGS